MANAITDEEALARYKAYLEHGSLSAAGRALGVSDNTIRRAVLAAAERGLLGTEPVLPGFVLYKSTAVYDDEGNLVRKFVQQRQERPTPYEAPENHRVKGQSTLVDAEGRIIQQWIKTTEERSPENLAKTFEESFRNFTPLAPRLSKPAKTEDDKLTVYIWTDWHIGLYSWGLETGEGDWDLGIARTVMNDTIREVIDAAPKSQRAIVLGLGDLLNQDTILPITQRSGNVLDSDTRYAKCLETLCDLVQENTERVAAKHDEVELVFKPGNHDEASTVGLRMALRSYWRNTERVQVDLSPDPFYFKRFGVNLIGGVHGDKTKLAQLPMIMANRCKEDWAVTTTRHFHTGHLHHRVELEEGGVQVFQHRATTEKDAYHAHHGYLGGRSMRAFIYHHDKGSRGNIEIVIP